MQLCHGVVDQNRNSRSSWVGLTYSGAKDAAECHNSHLHRSDTIRVVWQRDDLYYGSLAQQACNIHLLGLNSTVCSLEARSGDRSRLISRLGRSTLLDSRRKNEVALHLIDASLSVEVLHSLYSVISSRRQIWWSRKQFLCTPVTQWCIQSFGTVYHIMQVFHLATSRSRCHCCNTSGLSDVIELQMVRQCIVRVYD